jgi:murein DD-endopeptidase MepM/ murein hydrolase activator NlpD
VIVRTADVFALYAHLAPGTVVVAKGQEVAVGDVLGRVGHTGNSTAPHLHFQLMDSPDAGQVRGIACSFADYVMRRDGAWGGVHNGIPRRRERARHGASLSGC